MGLVPEAAHFGLRQADARSGNDADRPLRESSTPTLVEPRGVPVISQTSWPSARFLHAMAYDSKEERAILFGGAHDSFVPVGETWSYDFRNRTWTNLNPSSGPSPRYAHAMAYDSQSGRIVMFGGFSGTSENDTWSYDLATNAWTMMNPPTSPSARSGHAMVYDPIADRIILFGGGSTTGRLNDTWAYDLDSDTWTLVDAQSPPAGRSRLAMAYDSRFARTILFGGFTGDVDLDDTWSYDYANDAWTNMGPTNHPEGREDHAMAYDTQSGRVILFGGYATTYDTDETWSYDASNNSWTNLRPPVAPTRRSWHAMASDPSTGQVLLFGGDTLFLGNSDQTWVYDFKANAWEFISGATPPSAPESLIAYAGETFVNLTWQPPAVPGGSPLFYRVYRGIESGNLSFLASTAGSEYDDYAVTQGATYYYQVSAETAAGEGARSLEVSATPGGPPSTPSNVQTILVAGASALAAGTGLAVFLLWRRKRKRAG